MHTATRFEPACRHTLPHRTHRGTRATGVRYLRFAASSASRVITITSAFRAGCTLQQAQGCTVFTPERSRSHTSLGAAIQHQKKLKMMMHRAPVGARPALNRRAAVRVQAAAGKVCHASSRSLAQHTLCYLGMRWTDGKPGLAWANPSALLPSCMGGLLFFNPPCADTARRPQPPAAQQPTIDACLAYAGERAGGGRWWP